MTTGSRTIVVPLFNEERRVARCVSELATTFSRSETAIVFVDDGSTDGTARALKASLAGSGLEASVVFLGKNRGKGAAVRAGVLASDSPVVGFVDADLSTDLAEVQRCFGTVEQGAADVAVATRARPSSVIVEHQPLPRELAGKSFNVLVRTLGLAWMPDTQCGLKVFTAPVARAVFEPLITDGFAFDVEVLARARRLGARIVEVPVAWRHVATSRVRPVSDGGRMIVDSLRMRREMWRLDRGA